MVGGELHPGTDLVHGRPVAEKEEGKAYDAGDDEHHGEADEEGSGFRGAGGSVEKSVKLPLQVSSREKPLPMQ